MKRQKTDHQFRAELLSLRNAISSKTLSRFYYEYDSPNHLGGIKSRPRESGGVAILENMLSRIDLSSDMFFEEKVQNLIASMDTRRPKYFRARDYENPPFFQEEEYPNLAQYWKSKGNLSKPMARKILFELFMFIRIKNNSMDLLDPRQADAFNNLLILINAKGEEFLQNNPSPQNEKNQNKQNSEFDFSNPDLEILKLRYQKGVEAILAEEITDVEQKALEALFQEFNDDRSLSRYGFRFLKVELSGNQKIVLLANFIDQILNDEEKLLEFQTLVEKAGGMEALVRHISDSVPEYQRWKNDLMTIYQSDLAKNNQDFPKNAFVKNSDHEFGLNSIEFIQTQVFRLVEEINKFNAENTEEQFISFFSDPSFSKQDKLEIIKLLLINEYIIEHGKSRGMLDGGRAVIEVFEEVMKEEYKVVFDLGFIQEKIYEAEKQMQNQKLTDIITAIINEMNGYITALQNNEDREITINIGSKALLLKFDKKFSYNEEKNHNEENLFDIEYAACVVLASFFDTELDPHTIEKQLRFNSDSFKEDVANLKTKMKNQSDEEKCKAIGKFLKDSIDALNSYSITDSKNLIGAQSNEEQQNQSTVNPSVSALLSRVAGYSTVHSIATYTTSECVSKLNACLINFDGTNFKRLINEHVAKLDDKSQLEVFQKMKIPEFFGEFAKPNSKEDAIEQLKSICNTLQIESTFISHLFKDPSKKVSLPNQKSASNLSQESKSKEDQGRGSGGSSN